MRRRLLGIARALALVVAGSFAAGPADAQPRPPEPAPVMPSALPASVDVKLTVVRASAGAPFVDPRLSAWTQHLQRMPFQRFDLVSERVYRLHDAQRQEVPLPDGRTVSVTLASHDLAEAHVGMVSRRAGGEPVETMLTIRRNRAFVYVLQGGPDGGHAGALLVRVDVSY